ncbi:MAG: TRAP transporter substrate-binding protein [Rhodospirillales bacterium]|nr:TRAP transporter substrate-binding protein [Rhodospirillales bacterium]
MRNSKRAFLRSAVGVAAAAMLAVPPVSQAAPLKWNLADEYEPTSLTGMDVKYFIEELNKRIGDELQITYQGGGALGYKSVDQFDAVGDGAVESAITLTSQLSGIDPFFDLTSLPFLVPTLKDLRELWRVSKPEFDKIFEKHNMVVLWAMPNAPSGIHAKMPIAGSEQINGLRIRTYDAIGTKTFKAAGAAPLQIAWADLVPQLTTGGVDAVLTSADGGMRLSVWDYVSDFTAMNYVMSLFMMHVNKDAYDKLSPKARQAIKEVSEMTNEYAWKTTEASVEKAYKAMEANGMKVTREPPMAAFKVLSEASKPIKEEWLQRVGVRGQRIFDEIEKIIR